MKTFIRLSISPISSLFTAGVTAMTVLLAIRGGQLESIAGYSAGLSMGALAAVAAGGGTTLVYVSGSEDDRRAVRRVRLLWVAPIVLCVSAFGSAILPMHTELESWDILFGGLVALLNNFAEIEASYLKRGLRTPSLFYTDLSTRLVALGGVAIGIPFALATLIGTISRQAALQLLTQTDSSRSRLLEGRFSAALRKAYDLRLMGLTASYVIVDRATFIMAPLIVGATLSGVYSSILTLTQAVSALLVSGLQTVLAVRSSGHADPRHVSHFELATLVAAAFGAILASISASRILELIGVEPSRLHQALLTTLCLAIPLGVATRLIHFRYIAAGRRQVALAMGIGAASILVLVALVASFLGSIEILASAPVLAEVSGLAVGLALAVKRRLAVREEVRLDRD
ncbi:MAG: hypothetical protein IT193_19860 [Propionibacteriaceae bacterium]|nr:hypothetical protein [Propionibacteriaceae bacterium]